MAARTTLGFAFTSPLNLEQMKSRLAAAWSRPFTIGDSSQHGDYLGGKLTDEGVAKIFRTEKGFTVNLVFVSLAGDAKAQLAAAKEALRNEVLPALDAQNVRETDPVE